MRTVAVALLLLTAGALAVAATGRQFGGTINVRANPTADNRLHPSKQASIWAVGDAADGEAAGRAVGEMIAAAEPDRLLYLGDVYESGTSAEFDRNYDPAFGALKEITLPTPGNHDWPEHPRGYDRYWWGLGGGDEAPPFYAARLAGWQLISLNSEAPHDAGSEQAKWLSEQLSSGGDCRIAFWHRPRYSGGGHGDQQDIAPLWDLLARRATLVLNGHDHNMQRLKPVDGITTLISGAGGQGRYEVDRTDARLAFANAESYGALRLELSPGQANWRFVSVDGDVLDDGQVTCEPAKDGL